MEHIGMQQQHIPDLRTNVTARHLKREVVSQLAEDLSRLAQ